MLDLGCRNGELLLLLRDTRQARVRGVGIQESMIRACLDKGISVFQGNLDEGLKEYADGSYDCVILNDTLKGSARAGILLACAARRESESMK